MKKPASRTLSKPDKPPAMGRARPGTRRVRGDEIEHPAPKSARATAMRLAEEVKRLEAELAAARGRVAELERCADIDPLTGLLNRRGFDRELRRALAYLARYGGSAALVYLDLDRFKPINDRHGHAAGDSVLQAVAAALNRSIRSSDLVARLGGDEFIVLLWNLDCSQAVAKARALEAAVARMAVDHAGLGLSVDASAGIAMLDPAEDAPAMIARADAAMYVRKAERHAQMPSAG